MNSSSLLNETLTKRLLIGLLLVVAAVGLFYGILRDATGDETIYLRDAEHMARTMRAGDWFGRDGVGLHGFIWKLPAAGLFMVFGKSVFLATLTTLIFALLALNLVYRLVLNVSGSRLAALTAAILSAACCQFLRCLPTFLRDIPVMLSVVALLYAIVGRRSRWLIGILLLLMLDAKEYVFFVFAPALALWVVIDELRQVRQDRAGPVRMILARLTAAFTPAAVYLTLMLCTDLVPINMYVLRIAGLVGPTGKSLVAQFNPARATHYLWRTSRPVFQFQAEGAVWALANAALNYIGKFLHPRSFAFTGVSLVVIIPALSMSVVKFRDWFRSRSTSMLVLPLVLWLFIVFYLSRASHGRYLVAVLPLIMLFFTLFLFEGLIRKRFALAVLIATAIALLASMYFTVTWAVPKLILSSAVIVAMCLAMVGHVRGRKWAVPAAGAAALLTVAIGAAVAVASPPLSREAARAKAFGYNDECEAVAAMMPEDERVWVNQREWVRLPHYYRSEPPAAVEWVWSISELVPAGYSTRTFEQETFNFPLTEIEAFKCAIREKRVDAVYMVVSSVDGLAFSGQEHLDELMEQDWLELKGVKDLKNKKVFTFMVRDSGEDVHE